MFWCLLDQRPELRSRPACSLNAALTRHNDLRPVHTGNFVAIFGNKLLPKTATNCCRLRQQFVADLLPFSATICCRFRQQIVARNGNFVAENGNKLFPEIVAVFGNNLLPVWTGLYASHRWHRDMWLCHFERRFTGATCLGLGIYWSLLTVWSDLRQNPPPTKEKTNFDMPTFISGEYFITDICCVLEFLVILSRFTA